MRISYEVLHVFARRNDWMGNLQDTLDIWESLAICTIS
jgi:hypothetical protein